MNILFFPKYSRKVVNLSEFNLIQVNEILQYIYCNPLNGKGFEQVISVLQMYKISLVFKLLSAQKKLLRNEKLF